MKLMVWHGVSICGFLNCVTVIIIIQLNYKLEKKISFAYLTFIRFWAQVQATELAIFLAIFWSKSVSLTFGRGSLGTQSTRWECTLESLITVTIISEFFLKWICPGIIWLAHFYSTPTQFFVLQHIKMRRNFDQIQVCKLRKN